MKRNSRNFLLLSAVFLTLVGVVVFRPQSSVPPQSEMGNTSEQPAVAAAEVSAPTDPALVEMLAVETVIAAAQEVTAAEPPAQPDLAKLAAFDGWTGDWQAASPEARAQMTGEGARLAAARRPEFKALIVSNPRLALERSVPRVIRQDLPAEIVAQLEKPISAKGEYKVAWKCRDHSDVEHSCHAERAFVVDGMTYKASMVSELETLTPRKTAPLRGVVIDDEMAVAANAVRLLEPGERIPAGSVVRPLDPGAVAETQNNPAGLQPAVETPVVEIAGELISVSSNTELAALEEDFRQWVFSDYSGSNSAGFFYEGFPNPMVKRIGDYKILFIRTAFTDAQSSAQTQEEARNNAREVERIFSEWSYGRMVCTTTITPIVKLPWSRATNTYIDNSFKAVDYAKVAVRNLGYEPDLYDTVLLVLDNVGGVALGKNAITGGSFETLLHEIGHNLGAWHSGAWSANDGTVGTDGTGYGYPGKDRGNNLMTYGNIFDVMGTRLYGAEKSHFNIVNKLSIGWLNSGDVHEAKTSGVYRIYAFDQPLLEQGKRYGLVTTKDRNRNYYLEYRPGCGGVLADSAILLTGREGAENQVVDTTPLTLTTNSYDFMLSDAGVALGRTFSDLEADMHFTVTAKNETTPPSLDVVYNQGPFPGNNAPGLALNTTATNIAVNGSVTFTAVANDADGDALAYYWEFDDGVSAPNSSEITRTFPTAAQITAMVTVSDMKGGTARRHVVINVGAHGRQTVTGNITLDGQPLANVRLATTGGKFAYTDVAGNYSLAGVSTGNRTLTAYFNGYTFVPSVLVTPLNVIAGNNVVNWTATASSTFVTLTKLNDAIEGGANGTFRITRSNKNAALLVRVADPVASAEFNTDYTFNPPRAVDADHAIYWNFTIPAGEDFLDISVAALNDIFAEGPETIRLNLVHNGLYLLNSASAVEMTIQDTDTALPRVSVVSNDPYATESPADPGSFTFTRTGSTLAALNLDLAWSGTAINGTDINLLGNVTIPAGQAATTVTVNPVNDNTIESTETVITTLQASAGAYVIDTTRDRATVEILDDDVPVVTVKVADAAATETGPDSGMFLIQRTGSTAASLKVFYGVYGNALHGRDYASLSGEVTIPAGASTAPVMIFPYDDGESESAETVVLTLATVANTYTIGKNSRGVLRISDNDALPVISVRAGAIGTEGGANTSVIFRAVGSTVGNVTVNYAVSGTALSGIDFTALAGSVSIPTNGVNDVTLSIPIINDAISESTERVVITLTPGNAYELEQDTSAETFIRDSNSGGQVVTASLTHLSNPAEAGPVSGRYYITRTNSAASLTVNYALTGTATNGIDYANLPGTVTIPAGLLGVAVDVVPSNDALIEGIETVTLTVTNGDGYSPDLLGENTMEILDDEVLATTVGFAQTKTETSELPGVMGEFREIEVRLSAALPAAAATVEVVSGNGTSAQGDNVDWAFVDAANNNALLKTAKLTFAPGVIARNVRIRVKNDGMNERIEAIALELRSPRGVSLSPTGSFHKVFVFDGAVPLISPIIKEERWNNTNVYNNNGWNAVPGFTNFLTSFTTEQDVGSNYSRRLTGIITAPATGTYRFWIASDDGSRLFISTDATAANKVQRANVAGWASFQNWTANASQQSVLLDLIAGQSYFVEVQHLENSGGDHVSLAWQGPGFNRQEFSLAEPDDVPRTVRFAMAASSRMETDPSDLDIMVVLDRPAGLAGVTVDFTFNGTATAGTDYNMVPGTLVFAPGESWKRLPLVILSDAVVEGPERIEISLVNPVGAQVLSPSFHTTTIQDAQAPVISTLFITANSAMNVGTNVGIMVTDPPRNIASWTILAGNTGNAFAINPAGQLTLATPGALPNPGGMQLIVRATDNTGATGEGLVNVICNAPANGVVEERWTHSGPFEPYRDLTWGAAPTYSGTLQTFTSAQDNDERYSRRLTGYLKPTVSGDYTFYIAGDDDCRLYLSSDSSPSNKTAIIEIFDRTDYQQWDKSSTQKSAIIPLVEGRVYWMEVQHREITGGDHVSVAWQLAGNAREAIPAAAIFPHVAGVNFDNPPQPPSIALTSPAFFAAYNTGDNVTLTANIAGGTLPVTAVEFYRGSTPIGSDSSAPYGVTWANATAGNHALTAKAIYSGGAVVSTSVRISVVNPDPAGDSDGDGFNTGLELTLGTDPYSAASQPAAIYANLRAWWKFDETTGLVADDATGRAQDGMVSGATWTAGIVGNSLSFNGVDNGVLMTTAPSITGSGDFTVSAWVKLATGSSGGTIIQQREPGVGGNLGQYALTVNYNGHVSFSVYGTSSDQFNLTTPGTIRDGAWHLVAGTRQGVTGTIFVDGFPAATGSSNATLMPLAVHAVSVGYDHRDNDKRFNGLIDDVRIHERALSAPELKSARDSLLPNSAPVFTASSLTAIATEDTVFSGQLAATDVDYGDSRTFSKIGGPGWLSIAANGALSGTPDNSHVGQNNFTVRVRDAGGLTTDANLVVTVTNTNDAPLKSAGTLADFQLAERDAISGEAYDANFAGVASDPDGDSLTFTKTSGPAWLVVGANGALSGTPAVSHEVANTPVVIRATDPGGAWVEANFGLTVIVRRSLAVNYSNSDVANTGVLATENTNALNAASVIPGPVVWNNQTINDTGNGALKDGCGTGSYSNVTVNSFSSVPYSRGSNALLGNDASQRVFFYYLDDGNDGGTYSTVDSVGASIHLSGLQQFLTANRVTSYSLTLLFNAHSTSATPFHNATVRSGVPAAPSATAISNLPFLGTIVPTPLGDGKQPLPSVGTSSGGKRGWGRLNSLTADSITISLPVRSDSTRGSIAGFILTPVPVNGALPMPLAQPLAPDGYAQWLGTHFGEAANDPETAGETADPNGDGVANLLAYAMGIDPLAPPAPGATPAQRGRLELVKGNGSFHFDYQRDIRVSDIGLTLEDSASLGAASDWAPAVDVVEEILSEEGGIRTVRATYTPPPGSTHRFFRLRASQ